MKTIPKFWRRLSLWQVAPSKQNARQKQNAGSVAKNVAAWVLEIKRSEEINRLFVPI